MYSGIGTLVPFQKVPTVPVLKITAIQSRVQKYRVTAHHCPYSRPNHKPRKSILVEFEFFFTKMH